MFFALLGYNKDNPNPQCKDFDGNYYRTVKIGTQLWMAANLRCTHDSLGNKITCYRLSGVTDSTHGMLYSAGDRFRPIPKGWRLPAQSDVTTLIVFLGNNPGGQLKQTGTATWSDPNTGATNAIGFNAEGTRYLQYMCYACGLRIYDVGPSTNFWMHSGAFTLTYDSGDIT